MKITRKQLRRFINEMANEPDADGDGRSDSQELEKEDAWTFAETAAEEAQKLNQQLGWTDGGYSVDQSYWIEREIETGEAFAQHVLFSSYWQTYYDEYGIRPRWMMHLQDLPPKDIQAELDNLEATIASESEEGSASREEEEFWAEHDKEFMDQSYSDIDAADVLDAAKAAEAERMHTPEAGEDLPQSLGPRRRMRRGGRTGAGELRESLKTTRQILRQLITEEIVSMCESLPYEKTTVFNTA